MDERRRTQRLVFEKTFTLKISLPEYAGSFACRVLDISENGIRLDLDSGLLVPEGAVCAGFLHFGDYLKMPISLRVIRCEGTEVGAVFEGCDPKVLEALRHFISFMTAVSEIEYR